MGHVFRYCFPQKKNPAFIKNKKNYNALYIPGHYCFPGHILKPLTKKRTLKQDYSLWVILLIMPSMGGHFVFFLSASKQLHAALLSWRTTPAAIARNHVAEKTWKLMPSWKTTPAAFRNWFCNAKEVAVCGSYWCICRRWWVSFSSFPGILQANWELRYLLPHKT